MGFLSKIKKVGKFIRHPQTVLRDSQVKKFNKEIYKTAEKIRKVDKNYNNNEAYKKLKASPDRIVICINGNKITNKKPLVKEYFNNRDGSLTREETNESLMKKPSIDQMTYLIGKSRAVEVYFETLESQFNERCDNDKNETLKNLKKFREKLKDIGKRVEGLKKSEKNVWNKSKKIVNELNTGVDEDLDEDDEELDDEELDDNKRKNGKGKKKKKASTPLADDEGLGDEDDEDDEESDGDSDEDDEDENDEELGADDENPDEKDEELDTGDVDGEGSNKEYIEDSEKKFRSFLNGRIKSCIGNVEKSKKELKKLRETLGFYKDNEEAKGLCEKIDSTISDINENLLEISSETDDENASAEKLTRLEEINSELQALCKKADAKLNEITAKMLESYANPTSSSKPEVGEGKDSKVDGMDEDGDKPESHSEKEIEEAEKEDEATEGEEKDVADKAQDVMEEAQDALNKAEDVAGKAGWLGRVWKSVKDFGNWIFGSSEGNEDPDKAEIEMKEIKRQTDKVEDIAGIMKDAEELLKKLREQRTQIMGEKRHLFKEPDKVIEEINSVISKFQRILLGIRSTSSVNTAERKSLNLSKVIEEAKELYDKISKQLENPAEQDDSSKPPEEQPSYSELPEKLMESYIKPITDIVVNLSNMQQSIYNNARGLSDDEYNKITREADDIINDMQVKNQAFKDVLNGATKSEADIKESFDSLFAWLKEADKELNKILEEISKKSGEKTPPPLPRSDGNNKAGNAFRRRSWSGETLSQRNATTQKHSAESEDEVATAVQGKGKVASPNPRPLPNPPLPPRDGNNKAGNASRRKSLSDLRFDPNDTPEETQEKLRELGGYAERLKKEYEDAGLSQK